MTALQILNIARNYSHMVDPVLLTAIAMVESGGRVDADNGYARGLCQISEIALQDVNERHDLGIKYNDLYDPETNLYVAALYLKDLIRYFETFFSVKFAIHYALMSYNWGIGNVLKWLDDGGTIPEETRDYVHKVAWWYQKIRRG